MHELLAECDPPRNETQLAAESGVSLRTIQNLRLQGDNMPRVRTALSLAAVLAKWLDRDVTIADLFELAPQEAAS